VRTSSASLSQTVALAEPAPPARRPRSTVLWAALAIALYIPVVWGAYALIRSSAFTLAFIPIILVGYLRGSLWAALAAFALHGLHSVLLATSGLGFLQATAATAMGGAVGLVVGVGVGLLQDTDERLRHEKQTREKIQEAARVLALYDPITGLPNRTLLMERLQLELAHAVRDDKALAVMFLDVDNFKNINDSLGHGAGDELLSQVGVLVTGLLRRSDTLARFGAGSFVLLLPGMQKGNAITTVAGKMLRLQDKTLELDGQTAVLNFCLGAAVFPQDGEDPETLLRHADAAVNRAKALGRGSFSTFDNNMNSNAVRRLRMEADILQAAERDQLIALYQPQVDLSAGRILGVEVLARWQHPEHGLVSPGLFIPIAEDTGAINAIGQWVVRTACAQVKKWHDNGHPHLRLAANLSPAQLQSTRIVSVLEDILVETGFDPGKLELEITEALFMDDDKKARETLTELRKLGVSLSIDDFGTGYSSLAYLKRFRVDALKVDRSFITDIAANDNAGNLVHAMVTMAGALDMRVTAEGVETPEQWHALRKMGGMDLQGFLFSPPRSAEEVSSLLERPSLAPHLPGDPSKLN